MFEILFENSFLTLRSLNISLALGFLFGGVFIIRYIARHKMNLSFLTQRFLKLIIGILVGGRLLYFLEHLETVRSKPISILFVWDLNFSFFGLVLGGILTLYWMTNKAKEDFWAWVDALSLSALAMLVFAHVGFFLSGKYYGLPTDLPWGIAVEANHIPFITPLHPTELYATVFTLILLMYSVKKSKRIHLSGVIGSRAIMLYSLGMLGFDFLHGDPSMYLKIGYGILAFISFIAGVHCSHKTHLPERP